MEVYYKQYRTKPLSILFASDCKLKTGLDIDVPIKNFAPPMTASQKRVASRMWSLILKFAVAFSKYKRGFEMNK